MPIATASARVLLIYFGQFCLSEGGRLCRSSECNATLDSAQTGWCEHAFTVDITTPAAPKLQVALHHYSARPPLLRKEGKTCLPRILQIARTYFPLTTCRNVIFDGPTTFHYELDALKLADVA